MRRDTEDSPVNPDGSRYVFRSKEALHTVAGVAICFGVFLASFLLTGHAAVYVNVVALLVVFSGTAGAILLTTGWRDFRLALHCANQACREPGPSASGLVREILRLSVLARRTGAVRPGDVSAEWGELLSEPVDLVEDRYADGEVRDILEFAMQAHAQRIGTHADMFRAAATFAPSFGVAGSVIGLVGIMASLGNLDMILRHIPVALVSTLYGVVLGNLVLAPLGGRIRLWLGQDLTLKLIALEGACGLARNEHTAKLWRRMNALLPPDQRIGEAQLLQLARRARAGGTEGVCSSQPAEIGITN